MDWKPLLSLWDHYVLLVLCVPCCGVQRRQTSFRATILETSKGSLASCGMHSLVVGRMCKRCGLSSKDDVHPPTNSPVSKSIVFHCYWAGRGRMFTQKQAILGLNQNKSTKLVSPAPSEQLRSHHRLLSTAFFRPATSAAIGESIVSPLVATFLIKDPASGPLKGGLLFSQQNPHDVPPAVRRSGSHLCSASCTRRNGKASSTRLYKSQHRGQCPVNLFGQSVFMLVSGGFCSSPSLVSGIFWNVED